MQDYMGAIIKKPLEHGLAPTHRWTYTDDNCKYCSMNNEPLDEWRSDADITSSISLDGNRGRIWYLLDTQGRHYLSSIPIKFCPKCGRKLRERDGD